MSLLDGEPRSATVVAESGLRLLIIRRRDHFRSLSPHGFHRIVYFEWGDPEQTRVVICVHGVGRNGRDFSAVFAKVPDMARTLMATLSRRVRQAERALDTSRRAR